MNTIRRYWHDHTRLLAWGFVSTALTIKLLGYHLGSLPARLSTNEHAVSSTPLGWHGLYANPLDLPLKAMRSVVFFLFAHHGTTVTRASNVVFGLLAVLTVAWLLRLWHGTRTAVLGTIMFAASAWLLHTSRLASSDILYMIALPALLVIDIELYQRYENWLIYYGCGFVWLVLFFVPGLLWLVLLSIASQRSVIVAGWRHHGRWRRSGYAVTWLAGLSLLIHGLLTISHLKSWLGLPATAPSPIAALKQFLLVPYHLFIHAPHSPEHWLGKAPIMDVFALAMAGVGIYFYALHRKSHRAKMLAGFSVLSWLLIAAGGAVSLSVLVPVMYLLAGTGIAYLLRSWLHVFPVNPFARTVGIGLVTILVLVSSFYNVRAYFVAWNHSSETHAAFIYRP